MPMPSITELLVCTTCRTTDASRESPPAGGTLLEAVQALLTGGPNACLRVRGIACLNGCSRSCTVALQAPGKHTYFFGDLAADPETAAQALACARLHAHSDDGSLPRNARPERLRGTLLAKLPPCLPAAA